MINEKSILFKIISLAYTLFIPGIFLLAEAFQLLSFWYSVELYEVLLHALLVF